MNTETNASQVGLFSLASLFLPSAFAPRFSKCKNHFSKMSHAHGGRDLKRLRNSSGIPDATVRGIVDWISGRLGITQFDVECRNCSGTFAGRAYTQGSRSYHGNRRPFVVLRIGSKTIT